MVSDLEKAKIMLKLVRKGNWNHSYDRREHFKRFQDLDDSIKELHKKGWIIFHKKPKFEAYSLETKYKLKKYLLVKSSHPQSCKTCTYAL